jgi:hypothetical protein
MTTTGYRFASDDEYLDAVHDAAYERFVEEAVRCGECGTLYDQGYHPATGREPAWVEREECPTCGSPAIKDRPGAGLRGSGGSG